MKVNMTEATARKILATIPDQTKDPDLALLQRRLEDGLKAATGGGHLHLQELEALEVAASDVADQIEDQGAAVLPREANRAKHLRTAIPKLAALRARRIAEMNR